MEGEGGGRREGVREGVRERDEGRGGRGEAGGRHDVNVTVRVHIACISTMGRN